MRELQEIEAAPCVCVCVCDHCNSCATLSPPICPLKDRRRRHLHYPDGRTMEPLTAETLTSERSQTTFGQTLDTWSQFASLKSLCDVSALSLSVPACTNLSPVALRDTYNDGKTEESAGASGTSPGVTVVSHRGMHTQSLLDV